MNRRVVDASVAIKWFVPEVYSDEAHRYLDPALSLFAPELLLAETANILWKKVNRGELTAPEAIGVSLDIRQSVLAIVPMDDLFGPALEIALASGRSAYDSLYLALADHLSATMVTADRKLYNGLQGGPYARLVRWIEDVP